jgi:catechol 2,3-dioxygenase-like lactoylglutathione lyase family enzyme
VDEYIMSNRFHHAGLVVPDLDKGIAFYQALLGLKLLFRRAWTEDQKAAKDVINLSDSAAEYAMLGGDGYNIELFEYSAPPQIGDPAENRPCDPGIRHIGFEFDDIEAASERFVEAGGTMHHDPVDMGGTLAIYCRDPFGNIVELMQPVEASS